MNKQRWEDCGGDATEDEINLIVSILRNNIPFDVVDSLSNNEVNL